VVSLRAPLHGYALLSAILATFLLASRLAVIKTFPYTFIMVEIWACRISFCCTPIGARAGSGQTQLAVSVAQAEGSMWP
jgi:hypothetical protein